MVTFQLIKKKKCIATMRAQRPDIGYSLDDLIRVICAALCMHKINFEQHGKPDVDLYYRLNPKTRKVVRK